ncbi:patatin-like phospholipase family protein [Oligoflexia bacterium]|nr:patatin-like phospholipase family protein [Oligoflexia bacterium]
MKRIKEMLAFRKAVSHKTSGIGFVFSGGGSRAAYQVGALKALVPYLDRSPDPITVVVGCSVGALNGLLFSAGLKHSPAEAVQKLEALWRERTFKNSFSDAPSAAFFRAIKMAILQYMSPGPKPTSSSLFDPWPLMERLDGLLVEHGGLHPDNRHPSLHSVGVMTTVEGEERKPLLFLSSHKELDHELMEGASFDISYVEELTAKHGFASAALPSVLPPVELDTEAGMVRLVDGGISQNIPVDPAVRLGAKKVIVLDISGRNWWLDHYGEAHDTRPTWEVPADLETFCMRPPDTFLIRNKEPLGPLLEEAVGKSTRKFIAALGPTWPIFKLLKTKLGKTLAYEAMSYVALDTDYLHGLIERGYQETTQLLKDKEEIEFQHTGSVKDILLSIYHKVSGK